MRSDSVTMCLFPRSLTPPLPRLVPRQGCDALPEVAQGKPRGHPSPWSPVPPSPPRPPGLSCTHVARVAQQRPAGGPVLVGWRGWCWWCGGLHLLLLLLLQNPLVRWFCLLAAPFSFFRSRRRAEGKKAPKHTKPGQVTTEEIQLQETHSVPALP